jgi:hypothetical protein
MAARGSQPSRPCAGAGHSCIAFKDVPAIRFAARLTASREHEPELLRLRHREGDRGEPSHREQSTQIN